jgi:hypothetical protein
MRLSAPRKGNRHNGFALIHPSADRAGGQDRLRRAGEKKDKKAKGKFRTPEKRKTRTKAKKSPQISREIAPG